ncbi:hypothetical protein BCV72DRAFT_228662 [Rhizopus microsporus var. microsporus]|uniref:Uncharacterized protein n=2 Tax=Rhizopus microsporus TaxID=58291 RepID=A0A2G4T118_RHIZD|nr:uncharacterized protein RHIMIDRAFT_275937 [Rhizopus microsporus ATCC 52813]ORE06209.1 hypothetical protein BCV72DRAFT_228662 [Rhizopus microsporus var. microsporus]PHZ14691.1 hypothetical protein RHIMIDRAFT_275937 [Rhizopus microsporus ATCC 52813]
MYTNWSSNSATFTTLKWYRVDTIASFLHELRQYIINTPGKFSATYLPKPPKSELPASVNERFPGAEGWLCEAIGDWNAKFDCLLLAANVMVNVNRLDRKYPEYKTAGDAEYYCILSINELLHMIASPELGEVIKQSAFEQRYALEWYDDAEDAKSIRLGFSRLPSFSSNDDLISKVKNGPSGELAHNDQKFDE